ncbi:MAG: DUF3105 domain-containing protein [Candidatus Limnocylindria bacterium]
MSQTSTRRQRREQLREERHQRHRPPPPRRGKSRSGLWTTLAILAAVVALVVGARATGFFEPGVPPIELSDPKYDPGNEVIGQQFPDEGNAHIQAGQRGTYGTTPPTSGTHWGAPAAPATWGIKDTELADEVTTHNLEHGGIVISYKALTDDEVRQLRDLVTLLRQNGFTKIILQPYSKMNDARIAASAWRWQIKLATYDDVPIVKFVRAHYDGPDAPEAGVR